MCDGCEHGSCDFDNAGKKRCTCDEGWANQIHVPGFNVQFGPCTKINYCAEPCVHGTCPNDPYNCECTPPYAGKECDVIQCPVCCPPLTCDCSNPEGVRCHDTWHHDCCLVKSCFRGDTLVHTANGLVPIEKIKEGDMVITRHEDDAPSMSYLRRVDQVRKRLFPARDLVVFRTQDEDIWVTPDHLFFEIISRSWISSIDVKTSDQLQALEGRKVKLQNHLRASDLLTSPDQTKLVAVYDISVNEYDRYSVGKQGLLAASCNIPSDLLARDKQVWGPSALPLFQAVEADKVGINCIHVYATRNTHNIIAIMIYINANLGLVMLSRNHDFQIALMRIYVRIANFTTKPRFQSADL